MTRSDITTVDELWEAARRHFPPVSPEDQRAGLVLLLELAQGESVSIGQFAKVLGTSAEAAEAFTRESALSSLVYMGADGRIQGFYGLSVTPTRHQTTIHGRILWTWCAPDTLEHPELLGRTAEIMSHDPETGQVVHLTVSPDRIEAVEPTSVVMSMRRPEAWDVTSAAGIIASGCHYQFFFASRDSGERWVAKNPQTVLLSLGEVFAFMKRFNGHMFETELARRAGKAAQHA
jgi:alkylmercury lyase